MTTKIKYFTENQEQLARYGKALSHPVRVFILDYLANNLNKSSNYQIFKLIKLWKSKF